MIERETISAHEINKYEQQRSKNKKFTIMYDSLCYIMRKQTKKKTNFQFKKSFLFMNNKFSTNTIIVPKIKSQKSIFQSPSNETAIHVVTVTKNGNTLFIIQPKAHINSEKNIVGIKRHTKVFITTFAKPTLLMHPSHR